MSRRYLARSEAEQAINRGAAVEQWLGVRDDLGGRIIRWARIDKEPNGRFCVTRFEVYDPKRAGVFDVYAFPPVDVDGALGSSTIVDSASAAVDCACRELGADANRFVNAGMIQEEYRDASQSQ